MSDLTLTGWISGAGLLIGAGMGLYGLLNPRWAARLVRLRDDPDRPGGFSEFRATYGGLFFAGHATALGFMIAALQTPSLYLAGVGAGAALTCAALWLGTAAGRVVAIVADRQGGGFAWASVGFELVIGLMILSPLLPLG